MSLRRADHSSRGVLPTVLRRCVWSRNIKNGCSIYIYDISHLRVKVYKVCISWNSKEVLVECLQNHEGKGWAVQIIKFLIMQLTPLPCHLVPLSPKYSPQHPILKHTQPYVPSLNVSDQVSHPYKTTPQCAEWKV